MIVRTLGTTFRQLLARNYARFLTPVVRVYVRTLVSSRHKYTEGFIHVIKKDVQYTKPIAFRHIKGTEFVQRLTAIAFDVLSEYHSIQEWHAHQWENLYLAIAQFIKSLDTEKSCDADAAFSCVDPDSLNLDCYVIEDKIGDISTCAAVYRALRGESSVALKAMFNFSCTSIDEMLRLENFGAELLSSPSSTILPPHPNIIQITGHFVSNNVPLSDSASTEYPAVFEFGEDLTLFIEMPLYTCSMKEYLRAAHKLTEHDVLWVLFQVVSAVRHIHRHGIVHRDIKLDNILVKITDNDSLTVVLTDFGMAHTSLTLRHEPGCRKWGNPMLMPPEVAQFPSSPHPSSSLLDYSSADIWCVGSLVYELCGSENPFSHLSSSSYSTLPPLPSSNHILNLLTENWLSRDPAQRLTPSQSLAMCGSLLWLPQLFHIEATVTIETVARELALVTWRLFRDLVGCESMTSPEYAAFVEFVQETAPQDIVSVMRKFKL